MAISGLKGPFSIQMAIQLTDDNVNSPTTTVGAPVKNDYTLGTGSGQADSLFSDKITIAASSTNTIVLDNASIADIYGNNISFATIKGIRIHHDPASAASSVTLGGTFMDSNFSSVLFTQTLNLDGLYGTSDKVTGYTVGAGETITLLNNDGSNIATMRIELLGINA